MEVKPIVGHATIAGRLGRLDIGPARVLMSDLRDYIPDSISACLFAR